VEHVQEVVGVFERRACRVLDQVRSTQRYERVKPEGDAALVAAMEELRTKHKRSGYRGIWIRLRRAGWPVRKRVHRIWKAEGWQIRTRRRKRRGQGSSANSCVVRRAEHRGHIWTGGRIRGCVKSEATYLSVGYQSTSPGWSPGKGASPHGKG